MTLVSFGGWNFPRRVVDDHVGTRDGLTPVLQLPASKEENDDNLPAVSPVSNSVCPQTLGGADLQN